MKAALFNTDQNKISNIEVDFFGKIECEMLLDGHADGVKKLMIF